MGKGGGKSVSLKFQLHPLLSPPEDLQPSYFLLQADCKELSSFICPVPEFVSFGSPRCPQLQLLPVCSGAPTRARVCTRVCSDRSARAPLSTQTPLPFLGETLSQSNVFPLFSYAQGWPWIMSNNIQLRRMQITLSLCSPAMQLAAHLRDTRLVYT